MKWHFLFLIYIFIFTSCIKQDTIYTPKASIVDNSKTCKKSFYSGYIYTAITAELYDSKPSLAIFKIFDRKCFAIIKPEAIFQTNRIKATFNSMDCGFSHPIKVKGYLLDQDCSDSLVASHTLNNKAINYLEDIRKYHPNNQYTLKKYLQVKSGILEVKAHHNIFISIIDPLIFMHKNEINWDMLKNYLNLKDSNITYNPILLK